LNVVSTGDTLGPGSTSYKHVHVALLPILLEMPLELKYHSVISSIEKGLCYNMVE